VLQIEKLINQVLLDGVEFAVHSYLYPEETLFEVRESTHLICEVSWKNLEILIGHTISYKD
jgi:hypothetical protein